jgi:uncharacterized protein
MNAEPPHIDYEDLAQEAMRGVVRSVLQQTAKSGLPGDHHFFISFDTSVDGVTLSKRLREKYQNEMTIVLQHRFWDLHVADDHFEVKLTFDGIPERLRVPFEAIKVFFDPSVRYGLQFEDSSDSLEPTGEPPLPDMAGASSTASDGHKTAGGRSRRPYTAERMPSAEGDNNPGSIPQAGPSANESGGKLSPKKTAATAETTAPADDDAEPLDVDESGSAEIVSLDAFRKKS